MEQQTSKKKGSVVAKIFLFGCLPMIFLGIVCLVLLGTCAVKVAEVSKEVSQEIAKNEKDQEQKKQQVINSLETEVPSDLKPTGELCDIFSFGSDYTDIQRKNKEKEITGKVVEWKLKVYEVDTTFDEKDYKIQTSGDKEVGTFVTIPSPTPEQKEKIEAMKTGDFIKVKGYIDGVTMRNIEIKPAVLID